MGLKAQQYSYILHGLGAVATSVASTILDCMEISGRLCLLLLVLLDFWGCEPDAAAFQSSDALPSAASLPLQGVSMCWNGKISPRSLWLLLVGEPCCPLL